MFGKSDPTPGVDPIIGALAGDNRTVSGLDPTDSTRDMTLVTGMSNLSLGQQA